MSGLRHTQHTTRNSQHTAKFSILDSQFSILLILLLALLLRLLLWSQPPHQPANDEVEYITVARDLLAGRGWQFYENYRWLRAPLYPLFLAGSLWLASGDLHLAALPNIALSVGNVYLIYRLAWALVGRRAARVAALLAAILWTHATFASLYMSETLFAFLFTAGLICLVGRPTADRRPPTTDGDRRPDGHPSGGHRGASLQMLAVGGVLFGMATLTRSITLLFLPIVALWLLLRRPTTDNRRSTIIEPRTKNREPGLENNEQRTKGLRTTDYGLRTILATRNTQHGSRFALRCSLLFVLCALLTIAPWTIRNYRAYGRPILVETGLSFNLWFFNDPRESNDEIYQTLESIPNPAERSDYATAKGLARLREDPAILPRNLWPNLVTLLSTNRTESRFLMESYYADAGLPLFAAALLFDDALCLLILLAAVAGLALRRPDGEHERSRFRDPRWLVVAWVLYIVVIMLLTHGETRYRHFLYPVLIPYAAWALILRHGDTRHETRDARRETEAMQSPVSRLPSLSLLVVAILWGVILQVVLGAYPWGWAGQNLARGWHIALGDVAWAAGDLGGALRAYERATDAHETPDGWLRRGDAARALGDSLQALRAYREAADITPPYIAASARLGDLLRQLGDEEAARDAFRGDYADQQEVVDWSWRKLRPAPRSRLDVGDGLDFGHIGGVYPAEIIQGETARWTTRSATLRLSGVSDSRGETGSALALVRLGMAAPRPDGVRARAKVCAADSCHTLDVAPVWRSYTLLFSDVGNEPLNIEIQSDTFRPRDYDPANSDDRTLGVMLSWVEVTEID